MKDFKGYEPDTIDRWPLNPRVEVCCVLAGEQNLAVEEILAGEEIIQNLFVTFNNNVKNIALSILAET